MSTILLMTEQERVEQIEAEISGVKSLYNITQFDLDVLNTLKKQRHGGAKQLKILAQIEVKVFGRDFDMEPTKRKAA